MQPTIKSRLPKLVPVAFAIATVSAPAAAQTYAPWLTQIGLNANIASAANWGKNQLIAVVDTGIAANHGVFATGQVSAALSGCAAVSFRCSNGVNDDNGHGTAVASIAAGNTRFPLTYSYGGATVPPNSIIGVAPNANIMAQKVLAANGSGTNVDVVNGIMRAANAGASVINLSLTYMNSPDIVSAINYAAGKGAFIVWAGGNSAVNLLSNANTSGLTQAAINRLVFAGSVNAANGISSFSNKPGSGNLISTTGVATSYAGRWLMAPGENIVAPGIQYGSTAYMYWSGTSMSAPIVSGSLALLQSAWPILKTNGTTANLLIATSTDLGTKGTDAVYGSGRVNLAQAFQPYGTLNITGANGSNLAVPNITSSLLTSGALGNLATIKAKLASYTAFDGYQRNFTVNLSGLLTSSTARGTVNPLPVNTNTGPTKLKLADGGELFWASETASVPMADSTRALSALADSALSASTVAASQTDTPRNGYVLLHTRDGSTMAMGYGMSSQYGYAMSLFGNEDFARAAQALNVNGFADIAQGGVIAAYGSYLSEDTRIAFSAGGSNPTRAANPAVPTLAWQGSDAASYTLGLSHRFNQDFTGGISLSSLNERHGLLGGTYDPASVVSLGERNRTQAVGLSAAFRLTEHSNLLIESQWAATQANAGNGLLAGTTGVRARGVGFSYVTRQLWRDDDRLTVSMRQPLRVVSGQAGVVTAGVDEDGRAQYRTEWTSIVPDGRETEFRLAYDSPMGKHQSLAIQIGFKRDAFNVAGNNEASAGVIWRSRF